MKEVWDYFLFEIAGKDITVGQIVLLVLVIGLAYSAYRSILKKYFPQLSSDSQLPQKEQDLLTSLLRGFVLVVVLLGVVLTLNLNFTIYSFESFDLTVLLIIKALIFIQAARLLFWFVSNVVIHSRYIRRDQKANPKESIVDNERSVRKIIQYIFYTVVTLFALNNFEIDPTIFRRRINEDLFFHFKLSNIVYAILVILLAQLFAWVIIHLILYNVYKRRRIDVGSQYAINQLVRYVIYIIAFVFTLDVLGIDMNIVLGGAAALLVGLGLGLQQTFNDLISGVVLLFERSVSVGDILEFDGTIGTVKNIGLRSSTVETHRNISMVVPNHILVNDKVINWTHFSDKVRFKINLGVAYGSDTTLVKKLLLKSVSDNPYVLDYPIPFVRFENFGDSALDFSLYFFSRNYMVINDIKSDIRLEIDRLFRENNITIPFPQTDINIRTSDS